MCIKKDKRLLVLLALGFLIVSTNVEISTTSIVDTYDSTWIEMHNHASTTPDMFRLKKGEHISELAWNSEIADILNFPLKEKGYQFKWPELERVVALKNSSAGSFETVPVSSRLAFFLGRPFSINTANADELTLVQGIGPALAKNIIAYRKDHGPLTSAKELENIPGIGSKMKQRLQKYFIFSDGDE